MNTATAVRTKAPVAEHDQPMPYADVVAAVGERTAQRAKDLTTRILARGNEIAAARGILIADTKVEFGIDAAMRRRRAGRPAADRGGRHVEFASGSGKAAAARRTERVRAERPLRQARAGWAHP